MAELRVSAATAEKIAGRHGLEVQEVRDLVECVPYLVAALDTDEERGTRAIVRAFHRRGRVLVVLYPSRNGGEDVWHLGSAYFI